MDVRSLECFAVVAEELHFRRAAGRLNMTQPSLSARIQALEAEVGVTLLERNRRQVLLTDAGRTFLDHARAAVRSAKDATAGARRAAAGEIGRLRFGFTALTSYAGMPELVQRFRSACPGVGIDLVQAETARLEAGLLAEEIDIALLHPPLSAPGLAQKDLVSDEMVLALPASGELARLPAVPPHRLAGQPFLIGPRYIGPHLYDQIILLCRQAGFSPDIVQEVTSMTTLIGLAAAGVGCGFVTGSLQVIQRPGVAYRPLAGVRAPSLPTALAWRDGGLSAPGRRFLELATVVARARHPE